jgi:hypothetical protein
VMARLRSDGSLDRSFAHDGLLRRPMPGYFDAWSALRPNGGLMLFGFTCCRFPSLPFVQRMSKSGHLERHYAAATKRSLHGLAGTRQEDPGWEQLSLVQQQGGAIEVFGGEEGMKGLGVKLRPDGSRDPSFGKGGVKKLGFEVTSAIPAGRGTALLAAYVYGRRSHSGYKVMRLLPDGRIDPGFGQVGLPGADNEGGVWITPQGKRAAIVFDPGLPFCRQGCEADPKLYRVVIPRRSGP